MLLVARISRLTAISHPSLHLCICMHHKPTKNTHNSHIILAVQCEVSELAMPTVTEAIDASTCTCTIRISCLTMISDSSLHSDLHTMVQ